MPVDILLNDRNFVFPNNLVLGLIIGWGIVASHRWAWGTPTDPGKVRRFLVFLYRNDEGLGSRNAGQPPGRATQGPNQGSD